MPIYTKRVQTVLAEQQYSTLLKVAEDTGKPISLLIREAIEKIFLEQAQREQCRAALSSLLSLNAPVTDWPQMEEEILRDS